LSRLSRTLFVDENVDVLLMKPVKFRRTFYDTGPEGETLIYNVERLWELACNLPVQVIPLTQVEAELDYPYQWFKTKKPSPREVAQHAKLIYEADLSYPIILSSRGLVMDGIHRIARSWLLGLETIQAVQFSYDPIPDQVIPEKHPDAPFAQ
jgi:hypothetical protein